MTRFEKSDAQLDAEAEARRRSLVPPKHDRGFDDPDSYDVPRFAGSPKPDPAPEPKGMQLALRWLIVDLRRALRYETPDRLHQRHTSMSPNDELDARGWPKDADEGGVGMPFSSKMHRYLRTNSRRWDCGPEASVRPAMASIQEASERCHARHTSHLRPGKVRSLCAEMMFQVGYLGQEPEDLAWLHDLPLEQVEKMLTEGLRHAYSWRMDTEARLSRQPGTEEPMPERRPLRRAV